MNAELTKVVSSIGPKIKTLRSSYGYSLQQLADLSDVSAATIHKIEQSDMVPTVTTILKIASALNRPASYFVEEEGDDAYPTVVTRSDSRRPIYTSHSGIDLAGISGHYGEFLVAAARATIIPAASSGKKAMQHPGEELIYMLSGAFEFTIGNNTYTLDPGDSLHFRARQRHSWHNPGDVDAVAIWMALRPQ